MFSLAAWHCIMGEHSTPKTGGALQPEEILDWFLMVGDIPSGISNPTMGAREGIEEGMEGDLSQCSLCIASSPAAVGDGPIGWAKGLRWRQDPKLDGPWV